MSEQRKWTAGWLDHATDYDRIAKEHAEGDMACGRKWSCACAACRIVRAALKKVEGER